MRPFALIVILLPSLVLADATDDLLEAAAEQALLRRDATIAAAWVSEAAAATARGAYEKALAVAGAGGAAREVAVGFLASRLRQLRDVTPEPAGELDSRRLDEAVTAALERRSGAPIRKLVDGLARKKLDRAAADVRRLASYASGDLAGARLYVRAYAALAGYTVRLAAAAAAPVAEQVVGGPPLVEQICACECPPCADERRCAPCACVCVGADPSCPQPDEVTWIAR